MSQPRLNRSCVIPAVLLAAIFASPSAQAYILPVSSILRRMGEARNEGQASNLRLEGTLTLAAAAVGNAPDLGGGSRREAQADAVLMLKLPFRCRFEVATPEGARAAAVWSHGRQRTEGSSPEAVGIALAQICPLLASQSSSEAASRASLARYLQSLNVQPKTSLGRLGGQIAYVLGQPSDGEPQFWVYKDTFFPARVRWRDADKRQWDVRFLDYGSPLTGEAFPRVIELYRENQLLLRFSGLKSDAKTPLPEKLF